MRSGVASDCGGPIDGCTSAGAPAVRPPRLVGDDLVAGPAQAPAELDLFPLARRRLEAPGEHAAHAAHVALARRCRDGKYFDLDLGGLAGWYLILDHRLDRPVVAAAQRDFELALVGLGRRDDSGRALDLAGDGARDLDLFVGTKAETQRLVLRRERHLAAAAEDAVAIERHPAGQPRRILRMLALC